MENTNTSKPHFMIIDPVSAEVTQFFVHVMFGIVSGILSLFGVGANVVNIIVFVKQGFKETINISLTGLAVANIMYGISAFWMGFACSTAFADLKLPVNPYDLTYMTGSWSRLWSNRITSVINTYISLERCLCIAMPLKIKMLITPTSSRVTIILIFAVTLLIFSPFYYVNRLVWRYNAYFNRTLLTLAFSSDRDLIEPVMFLINSVLLPVICLVSVVCCTLVLVTKLNRKTKWRQEASGGGTSNQNTSSRKENKIVKLVTLISTIFITCYLPATVVFVVMCFYPEFGVSGVYINMYYVVWIITIILENINSSVIIFVYLKMSSKFRKIFLGLFGFGKK